jgi:hypothetical protein
VGGSLNSGSRTLDVFPATTGPMRRSAQPHFTLDRFGTVPIGAVIVNRVSLVEEALVVMVCILAHRRCDLVIMDW